jgi:transposase
MFLDNVGSYAFWVSGGGVEEHHGIITDHEPYTPSIAHSYDASAPTRPIGVPHRHDHGADRRVPPTHDHGPGRGLPTLWCPVLLGPQPRPTSPDGPPHKAYILKRWNAGCRDALQLFRAIQRHGYPGSYPTVARYALRLRQAQGLRPREQRPGQTLPLVAEVQHTPLTTRHATRVVLKPPKKRTDTDPQILAHLSATHSVLAMAITLAQDFAAIVRECQPDRFDGWLDRATGSGVSPLRRFATGRRADDEAVKAGLTLPWSTGPVEGPINRVKMLKRSMFGRAKLDLLSRRFLLAASFRLRCRCKGQLTCATRSCRNHQKRVRS